MVLPAPVAPTKATVCPGSTRKDRPRSTGTPAASAIRRKSAKEPPKCFSSVTTLRTGAPAFTRPRAASAGSRRANRGPSAGEIILRSGITGTKPAPARARRASRKALMLLRS